MHLTWFCLFHIIICTRKSSFLNFKSCGADSSQARVVALHCDWKLSCDFFLQLSYNDNKYSLWHWPHYEDGEPDEYEEGAADADHRECPKVDLTIACWTTTLSLQRYYNRHQVLTENIIIPTWEVVSADLLRKKLVVLLHLLGSKMAQTFCPQRCP